MISIVHRSTFNDKERRSSALNIQYVHQSVKLLRHLQFICNSSKETHFKYCQAKVQVQVQSLKSKFKVKSKVFSQKDLDFAYTKIIQPTIFPPVPHHISSCATHLITFQALPDVLQSSVIPFWKPLMTLYKNCKSFANFCELFCNSFLQREKIRFNLKDKERKSQIFFA